MQTQATTFELKVKTCLLERHLSVTALAKHLGLSRQTVSLAINHETMFPGVKDRIRTFLNLP